MADPNYNNLVARLNALKPSAVNLDPPTNSLDPLPTGGSIDEPLSREDALAQRLKSLRERREETPKPATGDPPPPYMETERGSQPPEGLSQKRNTPSPSSKKVKTGSSDSISAVQADATDRSNADVDRTLEEILDGLVLEDDHWSVSGDEEDGIPAKRVEELLANLGKQSGGQVSSPPEDMDIDTNKDAEDDDSEGEEMTRRVRDVLDRTVDELKLEGHADSTEFNKPSEPPDGGSPTANPPADISTDPDSTSPLSLPTVPTALQDPVTSSSSPTADDPFESSIAARLAALKGPGHAPITTDAFGLPSAPTFQPEDRPVPGVVRKKTGKAGFSDEDMKTWCIVCLEDATVRCAGCDGDVYCARCWKDMHVGPAAGWDERGHSWEKFDPRRI